MAKTRIKLNHSEMGKLLKSDVVAHHLAERAQRIAQAAGPGMEVDVRIGRARARASVFTATRDAMRAEASGRALTRALGAGAD